MAYRNGRDQAVASADFAKLAQRILQQRFLRACVYELPLAYLVAVTANANVRRGALSLAYAFVSPRTLAYTAATYVVGVVVLAVHARLYHVTRAAHGSHFPELQRVLRRPTQTAEAVLAYVLLASFLVVVHNGMFGGAASRMWLYPEGHYGPPQLNPGWLASWMLASVVGTGYAVQLIADERLQLRFPAVEQGRVHALKDRLPRGFAHAVRFALSVLVTFWVAYFVFGWGVYQNVCNVLARIFSTSSYGVGSPLFSAGVLFSWLRSSTLTVLTWELAHQLFEVIVTEPTHINELSLDRNLCLVSGLQNTDSPLIQHLAYQELYRLTAFNAEQRAEILGDIDRASGTMWSQVSSLCIGVVNAATGQLQTNAPPAPEKTAAARAASDGRGLAEQGASLRAGGAPMKDILQRNRRAAAAGQGAAAAARTAGPSAAELFGTEAQGLEKYVLTALRDMLLRSALGQRIMSRSQRARSISTFANFQQQVWAIRALMRLVECSIREDKYGVVQGDVGAVLGALFAYLDALEGSVAPLGGRAEGGAQTAGGQAEAMIQVLRNTLYAFTTTFYEYLGALKLPPAQARQLQRFADFQA
ncbi:hypothetical protein LPJ61_001103 [Coemansia biformis]|uniref:Nucleoporin protein Ndc1-Nup n=1 Tax=Coemansia biformis TaxID=1286918 RepID=A0A9W7YFI1_9FUNG|nr:hypothetical protein LPJ61_001103 [Coemansia biformis]